MAGTADGTLIATSSGDHSVIRYDVASGVRIGTPITIPDEEQNRIALSLDGRWLSVGGEADDGSHATQIWDLDPEHWAAAACRVATRACCRWRARRSAGASTPTGWRRRRPDAGLGVPDTHRAAGGGRRLRRGRPVRLRPTRVGTFIHGAPIEAVYGDSGEVIWPA